MRDSTHWSALLTSDAHRLDALGDRLRVSGSVTAHLSVSGKRNGRVVLFGKLRERVHDDLFVCGLVNDLRAVRLRLRLSRTSKLSRSQDGIAMSKRLDIRIGLFVLKLNLLVLVRDIVFTQTNETAAIGIRRAATGTAQVIVPDRLVLGEGAPVSAVRTIGGPQLRPQPGQRRRIWPQE